MLQQIKNNFNQNPSKKRFIFTSLNCFLRYLKANYALKLH